MSSVASTSGLSYAEYLELEKQTGVRHEYYRGEVVAMAGGTLRHAQIAMNFALALGQALAGGPCQVFGSDLKVRREENDFAAYPDLSVICKKAEAASDDANAFRNPVLVVEVLSPGTVARDRGLKAARYRQMPSLREYLLVSQDEPRIELFRRADAGHWELHEALEGEAIELSAVPGDPIRVEVDAVYRDPFAD